jgi:hypothetical protein
VTSHRLSRSGFRAQGSESRIDCVLVAVHRVLRPDTRLFGFATEFSVDWPKPSVMDFVLPCPFVPKRERSPTEVEGAVEQKPTSPFVAERCIHNAKREPRLQFYVGLVRRLPPRRQISGPLRLLSSRREVVKLLVETVGDRSRLPPDRFGTCAVRRRSETRSRESKAPSMGFGTFRRNQTG